MNAVPGWLWPLLVYALVLVLHLVVPARRVQGYVRDPSGRPLTYRLNGLAVFVLVIALWALGCARGLIAWDLLYAVRWPALAGACVTGLVFTLAVVLTARPNRSLAADLYLGRAENPQWLAGRVDAKMYLYLAGAVLLELHVLSFAAHHLRLHASDPSPGVLLYTVQLTFFLAEYLTFEEVHLYTYDFIAERVGFKLGWGCLVFYPFFYCVGIWAVAERPNPHTPPALLAACVALFFSGWMLSRGANLQKFFFKTRPGERAFGLIAPVTLEGEGGRRLLCSGFWALSRHINYLGELLMALSLAAVLGWPTAVGPWLYPLYYVALLVPRQFDDDRRCAAKYGPLWEEYRRRVRWRIVPFVY